MTIDIRNENATGAADFLALASESIATVTSALPVDQLPLEDTPLAALTGDEGLGSLLGGGDDATGALGGLGGLLGGDLLGGGGDATGGLGGLGGLLGGDLLGGGSDPAGGLGGLGGLVGGLLGTVTGLLGSLTGLLSLGGLPGLPGAETPVDAPAEIPPLTTVPNESTPVAKAVVSL